MSDTFTVKINEEDVELKVNKPGLEEHRKAQRIRNEAFADAIQSQALLRSQLDDIMKRRGMWDDDKEKEYKDLQNKVLKGCQKLQEGGNINEARVLALDIKRSRDEMRILLAERSALDNHTAEGQADNASFNYLISACLVYNNTGELYFKSLEDYLSRSTEDVAIQGAQTLAALIYGIGSSFEKTLPENQFLIDFKFVDEDLRFINKDGHLTDVDGHLINEDGHFVNGDNELVDIDGNRVDDDGNYLIERKPFVDDDGNEVQPVVADSDSDSAENTEENVEEKSVE